MAAASAPAAKVAKTDCKVAKAGGVSASAARPAETGAEKAISELLKDKKSLFHEPLKFGPDRNFFVVVREILPFVQAEHGADRASFCDKIVKLHHVWNSRLGWMSPQAAGALLVDSFKELYHCCVEYLPKDYHFATQIKHIIQHYLIDDK